VRLGASIRNSAESRASYPTPNGHRERSDQRQQREVGSTSAWRAAKAAETLQDLHNCQVDDDRTDQRDCFQRALLVAPFQSTLISLHIVAEARAFHRFEQDNPGLFRAVLRQYIPSLGKAQIDELYEAIERDYLT
jgi:hypothetical protein